jgi:hypothetical protein
MSMHQIDDKSSNEKSEDFLKGKVVEYEEVFFYFYSLSTTKLFLNQFSFFLK